jgi:hypothetical protein
MRQKSNSTELSSEQIVKGIRRATRKRYCAEEKIRIVLDGLRGDDSIAVCRRAGVLLSSDFHLEVRETLPKGCSGTRPCASPAKPSAVVLPLRKAN